MRKIKEMPTDGEAREIENVSGYTMATTAAVKNHSDVVKTICCMTVDETMTEEQMRPKFERVLQGQDLYGNTVMHYFALCKNDVVIGELLRVGGCMCMSATTRVRTPSMSARRRSSTCFRRSFRLR